MAVLSWWICIIQSGDFSSQILMCMRHFDFSSFVSISQISWMLTSIVEWHDVHFFPFRSRKIIWFDSNLDSVHFFGLQDSWAWFWVVIPTRTQVTSLSSCCLWLVDNVNMQCWGLFFENMEWLGDLVCKDHISFLLVNWPQNVWLCCLKCATFKSDCLYSPGFKLLRSKSWQVHVHL